MKDPNDSNSRLKEKEKEGGEGRLMLDLEKCFKHNKILIP
jgi:hypothetical protein